MKYFFQGLTMGLAYVAPIGLQNLFVMNSALTKPRRRAILTAVIVIFFDVTLAFACFFGAGAIMERFKWLRMVILLVGSVIVLSIGVGLIREKAEEPGIEGTDMPLGKTIWSACVVTWFNPQALVDGTMMLGAFHVTLPTSQSAAFIVGVACASFLWFTGLTLVISLLGSRFQVKTLKIINRICGAVIIFYGGKLLLNFIEYL